MTISPAYDRGGKKRLNPEYVRLCKRRSLAKEKGDMATYRELGRTLSGMATQVAYDPGYRRLKYVRFADDFILGLHGPECEAETIKGRIRDFLRDHLKRVRSRWCQGLCGFFELPLRVSLLTPLLGKHLRLQV